jgi:starch synthase (maltosyl-transferring)
VVKDPTIRAEDGRRRVIIEGVTPEIDRGRFPINRVVGERVVVEADIFSDSHDALTCVLLYRGQSETEWNESPMTFIVNDRWQGDFTVTELGQYLYTVEAWTDRFKSWRQNLVKKVAVEQDVSIELLTGAELIEAASRRASGADRATLKEHAKLMRSAEEPSEKTRLASDEELAQLMATYPDRDFASLYERELVVVVDREKARFSTWYEMFPRASAPEPGRHATFKDCEARLPYIAGMGFDVLYFPPIHPIGHSHRKGKNNTPVAGPDAPGSPWAIGSAEGGHKDVHPRLGTLEDFQRLVASAGKQGIDIAIDLAFQCTPDHPYVKDHPEWFRLRPDGTVQYAENPPKKYEDIYPLNFETDEWQALWQELREIVFFWIGQGVGIFRVDNPHTKPFPLWEWLIGEVKSEHPEVIFLAEAFTRPKVMAQLAKLGFTQSYTYFAWRNTKWELTEYFTELTRTDVREYFRSNLWPNTPDILTEYLQMGGRSAFMARLVLAGTLGANYGIYGPAFELCENRPKDSGSEEYLDSEKYEIKYWDIKKEDSLRGFITRVNRIRRENPALQSDWNLHFHAINNEQLICYSKHTEDFSNIILVVVNLDPHHTHAGWLEIPVQSFGLESQQPYQVHDLLSDARYLWHGSRNYVQIDPRVVPAHIFHVRRRIRTERDFDYFM